MKDHKLERMTKRKNPGKEEERGVCHPRRMFIYVLNQYCEWLRWDPFYWH